MKSVILRTLQYKGFVLNQRNCRQINIDAFIDAVCDSMRMRLYTIVANNCDEPSAKKRKPEFEVFFNQIDKLDFRSCGAQQPFF